MTTKIQYKRGTAARWAQLNPVLADGEPGYETDTKKRKTGDGVTAWVDLPAVPTAAEVALKLDAAAAATTYVSTLIAKGAGIDPTGATDSTPALQSLANSAATFGAAVSFPPGVYRLNSLTLGPLTRLIGLGAGTTRFSGAGVTAPVVVFKHQTSSVLPMVIVNGGGVTLENIEMQANYSNAPLLHIENGFESKLSNVRLLSVNGTALSVKRANNTKWYDVFVDNCGSSTAAAVVIKSPTAAEINQTNTFDVYNLTIERCQNVALDVAYGGAVVDGFYAEFLRFTNLHVESAADNGGVQNVDPLIRIGNVRNMMLVNPFIYGGGGYLIEHASANTQTAKLKEGVHILGGALLGQEDNSSAHLIHLTSGDDFALVGVRAGRFTTAVVKVESTYGSRVKIDPTSSLDGTTDTWLTDARTGWITPQANKSIGGTGTKGVKGGTVTTLDATGAARNTLDDGAGGATVSGTMTLLSGLRWVNRTATTSQTLNITDQGVVCAATSPITLTLPLSSNSLIYVKNAGTKYVMVAAPASGTGPSIDGVAFVTLMPGDGAWFNGRSSAAGTWSVVSQGMTQTLAGTPGISAGANLGAGAPAPTLDSGSNDNRGRIQFGTGTTPAAGAIIPVVFAAPFPTIPFVTVAQSSQAGAGVLFAKDVTTTGFNIGCSSVPAASQPAGTFAVTYRTTL